MSTSSRTIILEAGFGALLVAGGVAVASPSDIWLDGLGFHPAWIAVLVMAARYGTLGLFYSFAMTVAALAGADMALGRGFDATLHALSTRAGHASDLFAVAASLLVAFVAMLHEGRMGRLADKLAESQKSAAEIDDTMAALHDGFECLRARHDRIDRSLSLWRDLAGRLESGDAQQAATAALELAAMYAGAANGTVQYWDGRAVRGLAWHGRESIGEPRKRDITFDRTLRLAVERARPVVATEVENAAEEDSDVAVPILSEAGRFVVGVIALRGVSPTRLRAADLRDLVVVAQWLAPALEKTMQAPRWRPAAEGMRP
jgi:hypothetical protein